MWFVVGGAMMLAGGVLAGRIIRRETTDGTRPGSGVALAIGVALVFWGLVAVGWGLVTVTR